MPSAPRTEARLRGSTFIPGKRFENFPVSNIRAGKFPCFRLPGSQNGSAPLGIDIHSGLSVSEIKAGNFSCLRLPGWKRAPRDRHSFRGIDLRISPFLKQKMGTFPCLRLPEWKRALTDRHAFRGTDLPKLVFPAPRRNLALKDLHAF